MLKTIQSLSQIVALCTSAWIETKEQFSISKTYESHSVRVRGLKQTESMRGGSTRGVALCTSAWIETEKHTQMSVEYERRTLYECVD